MWQGIKVTEIHDSNLTLLIILKTALIAVLMKDQTKDSAVTDVHVTTSVLEILNCLIMSFENGEIMESVFALYDTKYDRYIYMMAKMTIVSINGATLHSCLQFRVPDFTPHSITC